MIFNFKKPFFCLIAWLSGAYSSTSPNQTDDLSPLYPESSLSFSLEIETADFQLPQGLQNFAFAIYKNKVLCISGRTSGLHGFSSGDDNFPPSTQNTKLFVVDLENETVSSRSLEDNKSDLTQEEIDSLSVVAAQYQQSGKTLYLVGGYGVDTATGQFSTKSTLSSIDIPGLIRWVEKPSSNRTAKKYIRQIKNPIFQVTGGELKQATTHDPFLLIFGQNFRDFYTEGSNGIYTEQVRTFKLIDTERTLAVFDETYKPTQPYYRRRDLNVVPVIQKEERTLKTTFMALSGVFTLDTGVWTVPVSIDRNGNSFMPSAKKHSTFKQSMNNYNSAHFGLFSQETGEMHTLLLGGISYQTCSEGSCSTDSEIPFTNNITDVVLQPNGKMKQYLLNTEYPIIYSEAFTPPRQLLFGAGARFIPVETVPSFYFGVFSLDDIRRKTLIGYVIGGIMSSLPNTNTQSDSTASPYIFKVYVTPR